jgi:hypothetical protein
MLRIAEYIENVAGKRNPAILPQRLERTVKNVECLPIPMAMDRHNNRKSTPDHAIERLCGWVGSCVPGPPKPEDLGAFFAIVPVTRNVRTPQGLCATIAARHGNHGFSDCRARL